MAQVHINNIIVRNNPAKVEDPLAFDITFECFSQLPGTFDWKIIYIGSPNNSNCDQIIDQFDMDNLAPGVMNFTVESNCPNFSQIPEEEIIGMKSIYLGTTAIIISVSYEKQEFFRCGYYVRNEYDENIQEPPKNVSLPDLRRYILSENPRIFRFEIEWAKREGNAYEDNGLLQQNLEMMGGDPFQQSNGAFQELQKMQYSYGMFQNNGNQVPM